MIITRSNELPNPATLFSAKQLIERHPNILTPSRMSWAIRRRHVNGLASCVYPSPLGEMLFSEPDFIRWVCGLQGKQKLRKARRGAT